MHPSIVDSASTLGLQSQSDGSGVSEERREAARVRVGQFDSSLSVAIRPKGTAWFPVSGDLMDISMSGAGIRVPPGALGIFLPRKISLGFELEEGGAIWVAEAILRRYLEDTEGAIMGVQFSKLDDATFGALGAYVAQRLG